MKIKSLALALALGSLICSASAFAGDDELKNEFGGQLSLGNMSTGGTSTSYGFGQLYFGHFFNPHIELLADTMIMESGGSSTVGFDIGGNFYFTPVGHKGNVAPYVGGSVGETTTTGQSGLSQITLTGGVKYFITEKSSINLGVVTTRISAPTSAYGTGNSTQETLVTLGVSTFF